MWRYLFTLSSSTMIAATLMLGFDQPLTGVLSGGVWAALCVIWMERTHTYSMTWRDGQADDRARDIGLALIAALITQAIVAGAATLVAGLDAGMSWPLQNAPLVIQILCYLLVVDLLAYLSHRLMHTSGVLWLAHKEHHRATRLYWLNTFRVHPLDAGLSALANLSWAALFTVPPEVVAIASVIMTAHLFLQHGNIAIGTHRLAPWLATAEFHRWHHDIESQRCNYGHVFGIWDVIAGTYRPGEMPEDSSIGVKQDERPHST